MLNELLGLVIGWGASILPTMFVATILKCYGYPKLAANKVTGWLLGAGLIKLICVIIMLSLAMLVSKERSSFILCGFVVGEIFRVIGLMVKSFYGYR